MRPCEVVMPSSRLSCRSIARAGTGRAAAGPRTGLYKNVGSRPHLVHQFLVTDTVRLIGRHAFPALEVGGVLLIVPLVPDHLTVPLEGQDVGGDAIQEPAVMADHDCAAGELE